jgi:hypothetical protein
VRHFIQYSICAGGALTLKRRESRPQRSIDIGALKGKRDQRAVNACKRASEITPSRNVNRRMLFRYLPSDISHPGNTVST